MQYDGFEGQCTGPLLWPQLLGPVPFTQPTPVAPPAVYMFKPEEAERKAKAQAAAAAAAAQQNGGSRGKKSKAPAAA